MVVPLVLWTRFLVAERHVHMRFLLLLRWESLILSLPEAYRIYLHGGVPYDSVLDSRLARASFLPIIDIMDIEAEGSTL